MQLKQETHRPHPFVAGRAGWSKPPGLPVAELDMLERRRRGTDLVTARGEESVEIGLLDPDAAAPALAAESVMLEQSLRAPLVHQRIRYADAHGNLFWSEHITTCLSIPVPQTRRPQGKQRQNAVGSNPPFTSSLHAPVLIFLPAYSACRCFPEPVFIGTCCRIN
jgi:hypothetical protein